MYNRVSKRRFLFAAFGEGIRVTSETTSLGVVARDDLDARFSDYGDPMDELSFVLSATRMILLEDRVLFFFDVHLG